jgi:hypothetical protein
MNGTMISPSPIFKLFRAFLHDVAEAIEDGMERNRGLSANTYGPTPAVASAPLTGAA